VDVELPEWNADAWEESVVRLLVAVRRSILRHPNAAPLLLQFFPKQLLLPTYDRYAAGYPLPVEWRMLMLEGLEKLTFGSAFFEAAARARSIEPMPAFDHAKLPSLAAAIRANSLDDEGMFVETLHAFIAGCRTRHSEATAADAAETSKPARKAKL
jgi:hypothetical protein